MHERGKPDGPVVPAKLPNKAVEAAAEAVEERGPAKGNTGSTTHPGRSAGHDAPSGLDRVREVARRDKEARFTALLHHVTLERLRWAYWAIRPQAAPGVDGVTWAVYGQDLEGNLHDLHRRLHAGSYRAKPSRRAYIPKADGRQRPLGIAALEDKIAQRAVVEVLNAIYEEDFLGFSYGFRPGRKPHDALDALAGGIYKKKVNWILDADIRGFLDAWSHCSFRSLSWSEQPVLEGWRFDTQAFPASGADVHGAEPSVLDTLHDGLAGDAVGEGGFEHGEPAVRGVVDEQGADFGGEADPPGGAGGELLAADEPVVEPPVQRGRGEAAFGGGVSHGEQFSFLRVVAWLVAGEAPVVPQARDLTR